MHHVTCGSAVKLSNMETRVRLHSHDIKYGTGSGQQSVTGIDRKEDGNSYWLVKAENGKQCTRGYVASNNCIVFTTHFIHFLLIIYCKQSHQYILIF